jgi:hypothetical protein
VDTTTAKDKPVAGKPAIRLGNVSAPILALYKPKGRMAAGRRGQCDNRGTAILPVAERQAARATQASAGLKEES